MDDNNIKDSANLFTDVKVVDNTSSISSVELKYLQSIDDTLKSLLAQSGNMSQSAARQNLSSKDDFRNKEKSRRSNSSTFKKKSSFSKNNIFGNSRDSFLDGFESAFTDAFFGPNFKDKIGKVVDDFASEFGINLDTIRSDMGKELGKQAMSALKNTKFGKDLFSSFDKYRNEAMSKFAEKFNKGVSNYDKQFGLSGNNSYSAQFKNFMNRSVNNTPSGTSQSADMASEGMSQAFDGFTEASGMMNESMASVANSEAVFSEASTAMAGEASATGAAMAGLSEFIPEVALAMLALTIVINSIQPAIEGAKKLIKGITNAMNRAQKSRSANLDAQMKRITADLETYIQYPFQVLEKAADDLYQAWDNNIQKINGTQGYTKADLQDLISDYASRLRAEGLSDVVSSADITNNLAKVLDSGLSGYAAEEFAYMATILNKAVPSQDFFNYADEYAELAGRMIAQGSTEYEAVQYANSQIESFANNVLYASRSLTGGFTTGLKDASSILEDSIKIAQSAKIDDITQISGVLSAVQAITGSVAPDLASSMTDAIVKAATGGNSSEIVALRSLSGVNASNTEFLKQLAQDPKSIFESLFTNLANMQNMSNDAFMEVAEGLSSVFGVSMDAFARIDFNYLAQAISNMNTTSASLSDNISLLSSGETTTSAEALRIQQINKYMIDEGLAYVMDNEAARAIQQHMWDEQMTRELTEAEYSVNLRGSALEFLEGIKSTIENILSFLNPFVMVGKLISLFGTSAESVTQRADLQSVLEATKVGNGNILDLRNLTTTNANLHLTGNLAELLTGSSAYKTASTIRKTGSFLYGGLNTLSADTLLGTPTNITRWYSYLTESGNQTYSGRRSSAYTWSTVGKSVSTAISDLPSNLQYAVNTALTSSDNQSTAAEVAAKQALATKMKTLAEDMGKTDSSGNLIYSNYEAWKSAASSQISDWESALEAAGISESDLQSTFQSYQTKQGALLQQARLTKEESFWDTGIAFWQADPLRVNEMDFWKSSLEYQTNELDTTTEINTLLKETTNKLLLSIQTELKGLHQDWVNYYIKYTTYGTGAGEINSQGRRTYSYSDVADIANKEKEESYDAVHALAEALTKNIVDLHDPQVQTNAILGRILLVIEAILQQNQSGGQSASTFDSLIALATGKL